MIVSPALKSWGPPNCKVSVVNLSTCGPLLVLSLALKRWGLTTGFYVANLPTCVPLLILSPALKRWGSPKREASCSQAAHLQATADFVPRSKVLGTPHCGTGYLANLPTCGLLLIVSPTVNRCPPPPPLDGRGYVANLLSCGPLLVGSNALKGWGPPSWQGLCGPSAHLQENQQWRKSGHID